MKELNKRYYSDNRSSEILRGREYRAANKGKMRALYKTYKQEHPHKVTEHGQKRRATKLQAMPTWADRVAIAEIFKEAKRLTKVTGIPHHVDHIIPLQHPLVCGLHVPANLRPIPASTNASKSNKFDSDLFETSETIEEYYERLLGLSTSKKAA